MTKVRAFFRFITAQNVESVGGQAGEDSALWYLNRIKNDTGDYTDLFLALCKYGTKYKYI